MRKPRWSALALVSIIASLVTSLGVGGAQASDPKIYWVSYSGGTNNIGSSALDGSGVNESYYLGQSDSDQAGQLVAQGDYLYWVAGNKILKALKDGTGSVTAVVNSPRPIFSVTADTTYLYWGTNGPSVCNCGAIGRSFLDGTSQNDVFVGGTDPSENTYENYGMFVTADYIYWGNYADKTIGRVRTNGTGLQANFINIAGNPNGVWVQGDYIYWSAYLQSKIGRANIDGSNVDDSFISTVSGSQPQYVTVADDYIYWTNWQDESISRARLDGSAMVTYIGGLSNPIGLVVDSVPYVAPSAPAPQPVPDPLQQSRIISFEPKSGVIDSQVSITFTGEFPEDVRNISLDGEMLPQGAWSQTANTITVKVTRKLPGTSVIQIFNGSVPLLAAQSFTFTSMPVTPTPAPSATPTATPTPVATPEVSAPAEPEANDVSAGPLMANLSLKVQFAMASFKLTSSNLLKIEKLAKQIAGLGSKITVNVTGYAQPTPGSEATDGALSKNRAAAVAKALRKFGVNTEVTYVGAGRTAINDASSRYVEVIAANK